MSIETLVNRCYKLSKAKGFWDDERNFGEAIALVHSELSEALEGKRKDLNDDHLPQFPMWQVELADAMIRILDLCGGMQVPIGEIIEKKLEYNAGRPYKHNKKF